MLIPRMTMIIISRIKAELPSKPVSSATAGKIKSEIATGMKEGLPKPGPVPARPPAATAIWACTS